MNTPEKVAGVKGVAFGGDTQVPLNVARCPECGGMLRATAEQWEPTAGRPIIGKLFVDCENDPDCTHRYRRSDWQVIFNKVEIWCGAVAV